MIGIESTEHSREDIMGKFPNPTALEIETGLMDPKVKIRHAWATRTDITFTYDQITRGITSENLALRLCWLSKTDIEIDEMQVVAAFHLSLKESAAMSLIIIIEKWYTYLTLEEIKKAKKACMPAINQEDFENVVRIKIAEIAAEEASGHTASIARKRTL